MTSTLSMHMCGKNARAHSVALLLIALLLVGTGCARDRLVEPVSLHSPYDAPQVWAIAPFANESGVSHVDPYRIADFFAQQAQDIHGVNVIPVNRVILAMRELEMLRITGPSDVRLLISALGVDGMVVGTITAYDPYRPMTLGAAVELHLADRAMQAAVLSQVDLDTWKLVRSPIAEVAPAQFSATRTNPVAQAAGIFDATNHRTLSELRAYAQGRSVPDSAFGRDIYLVSMDMYAQFVGFRLLRDLLHAERMRLVSEAVGRPDDRSVQHSRR